MMDRNPKTVYAIALTLAVLYVLGIVLVAFIKAAAIILALVIVVSAFCGGSTLAWEKVQELRSNDGN